MSKNFMKYSGLPDTRLTDTHDRTVTYLRVSITDRCNLNCVYCNPSRHTKKLSQSDILTYEELLRVMAVGADLGITKIRITGGEPLVRKDACLFMGRVAAIPGITDISLTTNGVLLARFARDLAGSGIRRVNVGLDTLRTSRFAEITGTDGLREVLRGIDAARSEGIAPLKVNVVVMRGVNDDEVEDFIAWGRRERLDVRFIEFMPVRGEDLFASLAPFAAAAENSGDLEPAEVEGGGPARSFRYRNGEGTVGFIMPRTRPFCDGCNRLRLTADGTLLPCLFSRDGIPLREALRGGGEIEALIRKAVQAKPEGHNLEMRLHRYGMHALGG
jgi:cyclic pyranopterin phosphate synthase